MTKKNAVKIAARAEQVERGGKYERYLRKERGPDIRAAAQDLPTHYFGGGGLLTDDPSLPQFEVVNVMDFDATDFDRTLVYTDSKRGEHVPSLNEHIGTRERETGWKLIEVRPLPALDVGKILPPGPSPTPSFVPMITLVWSRLPTKEAKR